MPIGPGETFERYAIEALIGRGGMGEVYRAVDTRLRRKVALKVIRPDKNRPDAEERLYREARAAAALTHPNAVAVHDVGEAEGVFFIVMELVVGQPLLAFVGDVRVTMLKKIAWITAIARALGAAHRAGIIHRDVKPSNVMVSEDGFAKVLDFGLARPLGPIDPVSFRTQEGRVLGTLRYMAPEQIAGAEADASTDQYAFGLTAYELLAGTHPGGAMIDEPPKPIDELAPDVPRDVVSTIDRTLARDPGKRFASMDDVAHALEAATAPPPFTGSAASTSPSTAQTMSGAQLEIAMRPSNGPPADDLACAPTLAALAEAGARDPGAAAARTHDATLISKEAPSALVRGRDPSPIDKTLPAMAAPPAAKPPAAVPRTLVSGLGEPPAPAVAVAAPIVTIPSAPPPRMPPSQARSTQRTALIVGSVAVLAVAAFAGTYFGSQRAAAPPPSVTVTSRAPPPSASAPSPAADDDRAPPIATVAPLGSVAPSARTSATAPARTTAPATTGKKLPTTLGF